MSSAMVAGVPRLTVIDAGFGWRVAYASLALPGQSIEIKVVALARS
ncbi:MAG: hypothetical protein IT340_10780 [Chloroflexi bacterium]|nr:hypothetical protein [Chloroflexota bacterium]